MKKFSFLLLFLIFSQMAWALSHFSYQLVTAQSMTADFTSATQDLTTMEFGALQATWTGTPVGTLAIQASNDNIHFNTVTGSSVAVSGAGSAMWNIQVFGFRYIQLVYVAGSSTGTLNAIINAKGN